jgi:hypothetical protein
MASALLWAIWRLSGDTSDSDTSQNANLTKCNTYKIWGLHSVEKVD